MLANIMLDDLDKEIERRVTASSATSMTFLHQKRTSGGQGATWPHRVHREAAKAKGQPREIGIAPATKRGLLGFGSLRRKGKLDIRIDPKARKAMLRRIPNPHCPNLGNLDERAAHRPQPLHPGMVCLLRPGGHPSVFEQADEWLRRRLRQVSWKQCKPPRNRARNLRALGIPKQKAYEWTNSRRGSWRIAGSAPLHRALLSSYWSEVGLVGFKESYGRVRHVWRTA